MKKSPFENLNNRGSELDKREKPKIKEIALDDPEIAEEELRLNENDPLKNYIPIEDVADPSNDHETFGEPKEEEDDLGGIVFEEGSEDLPEMGKHMKKWEYLDKLAEKEPAEIAEMERKEEILKEIQERYPETDDDTVLQDASMRKSSSKKIGPEGTENVYDEWDRDTKKMFRTLGKHPNRKTEKKKLAYRAARNDKGETPYLKYGFVSRVKDFLGIRSDEDQNKAA